MRKVVLINKPNSVISNLREETQLGTLLRVFLPSQRLYDIVDYGSVTDTISYYTFSVRILYLKYMDIFRSVPGGTRSGRVDCRFNDFVRKSKEMYRPRRGRFGRK